jgi:hypothetical protein
MDTKNGSCRLPETTDYCGSNTVDSYRPTQYKGFRVNGHPTKVSVDNNKQQTFSMDISGCAEKNDSFVSDSSFVIRNSFVNQK